jgi:hypothetical protein
VLSLLNRPVIAHMANQVSAPRPQSGTFTINFDDISTDNLGLTNHLYAAVPTRERDDVAFSISASSVLSRPRDETPGTGTSQTSHSHRDSTIHANLTQSVYQRWVSTPFDVLVSFVPLFSSVSGLFYQFRRKSNQSISHCESLFVTQQQAGVPFR